MNSLHTRDKSKGNGRKEVPRRRSSGGFGRWPDLRARVNLPETDGTQKEGVGVFFCRTPFGVEEKPKRQAKGQPHILGLHQKRADLSVGPLVILKGEPAILGGSPDFDCWVVAASLSATIGGCHVDLPFFFEGVSQQTLDSKETRTNPARLLGFQNHSPLRCTPVR